MDNLCHTLVGAALGETGLKRRTALGMATLLIGANLPDVDVLAIPLDHGLDFRRGWTHGVLALAVLPFVLTALVLAWDRWVRRRGGRSPAEPARPRWVLLLATVAILSHPLLDWLNSYGMRWLMPFEGRWFYGDALFIIDPWIWAALAAGVLAARNARAALPARLALAGVGLYIVLMLLGTRVGRGMVREAVGGREAEVMAGPVPVNPFRREVVVRQGGVYRFGALSLLPRPRLEMVDGYALERNADHPAARLAAATPEGSRFLVWSRFPFFTVWDDAQGVWVRIDDARYSTGIEPSWAAVTVRLAPAPVYGLRRGASIPSGSAGTSFPSSSDSTKP